MVTQASLDSIACDEQALRQEVARLCELYGDRMLDVTLHLPVDKITSHRAKHDEDRGTDMA